MKVRVYTDYDPVRIVQSFDESKLELVATKCGLVGAFTEMDSSELPKTREDRNEWEVKAGKVQVNAKKKAAKEALKQAKKEQKDRIKTALKTLGLNDSDLKEAFSI